MPDLKDILQEKLETTPSPGMHQSFHQQSAAIFKCSKCKQRFLTATLAAGLMLFLVLIRQPIYNSTAPIDIEAQLKIAHQIDALFLEDIDSDLAFTQSLDNNG